LRDLPVNAQIATRSRRTIFLVALAAIALSMLYVTSPVLSADNEKWFVCKYVGTPGVDETLQTGNNPISVAASAIGMDPVVAGTFFADSQGRSYVLVADTGQEEPSVDECPPPGTSTPSPSAEQSVAGSEAASGEQSVEAGTGTPAASVNDSAFFGAGSSPLPTIIFSLILLASLGTLAYANVKTVRSRN
jgi:hypothetical protein